MAAIANRDYPQAVRDAYKRVYDHAEVALSMDDACARKAKREAMAKQKQRLEDAHHNVRVLTVAAMRPNVTAEQRQIYVNLERSFRVEVLLLLKEIKHLEDPATVVEWRKG